MNRNVHIKNNCCMSGCWVVTALRTYMSSLAVVSTSSSTFSSSGIIITFFPFHLNIEENMKNGVVKRRSFSFSHVVVS